MKWSSLSYCALILIPLLSPDFALGQTRAPKLPGSARNPSVGIPGRAKAETTILKSNYRIEISATQGEKKERVGNVSTLTCSSKIELDGPMKAKLAPGSLTLSGTLEELEDGKLLLHYTLGLTIPQASTTQSSFNGSKSSTGLVSNIQYRNFASKGSVRIKPGRSYDLLRAGESRYTISVTPEREDEE